MVTDAKRLQQILKNLLSNAFKFTHQGQVTLDGRARPPPAGARTTTTSTAPRRCIAFSVTDTGIGISAGQAADHLRGVPAGRRLAPAASTAAPAWAWRSAASCRGCSAARSAWSARRARAAPSRSTCRRCYPPSRAARKLDAARGGRARRSRPRGTPASARRCRGERAARRAAAPRRSSTSSRRPVAVNEAGDDRDNIQPGRPGAADRRERPRLRPLPARGGARARASRAWSRRWAPTALSLAARVPARRRSRSTSTCPTSRAGACSTRLKNDLSDAPHPGVRDLDRRGARARARRRAPARFVAKPLHSRKARSTRCWTSSYDYVSRDRRKLLLRGADGATLERPARATSPARGRRRHRRPPTARQRCDAAARRRAFDCVGARRRQLARARPRRR